MKLLEEVAAMRKRLDEQSARIERGRSNRHTGAQPDLGPRARRGEDILSSRGFQFGKMLAAMGTNACISRDEAKIEMDFCDRLTKSMRAQGFKGDKSNSVLAPLWPEGFTHEHLDDGMYSEMKSLLYAGVAGADEGEAQWLAQKHLPGYGQKSAASPAMSWIDQTLGASFVGPAMFGAPIELLRAQEAMMKAGASVIPLGPTGSITFPRLLQATTGGWSAENTQATPNTPKTGSLNLRAKKVISVVVLPGELLRFGSPASEAVIRTDIFKTVALIADYAFLQGPGSDNVPLGLATMGAAAGNPYGITIVTPSNSNQLAPQDVYAFLSGIEEANGEATAWIMRPKMAYAIYSARWTPYSTGTSQGGFMFDLIRGTDGKMSQVLSGLDVVRTTQVSNKRGSGSQTYVLCLNGPDYYIGMFGAIEFTQTDAGYTLLSSDQVAVRAILSCDGGPRHPAQVAFCDALNFTVAG